MTENETLEIDGTLALHADLTTIIQAAQQRTEREASALAAAVIEGLKKRYGGDAIYIPRGLSLRERHARDKAIRAEFDGRNGAEVCARHGVSRSQLYRILGRHACGGR